MERVTFNGWKQCVRCANEEVELIVTTVVGPRIIRFGFIGERNVFEEIVGQQGGAGEEEWMIRGGHRFWIAPEEKPRTYELDNTPIQAEACENGVKTYQAPGPLTGVSKAMAITLEPDRNDVRVVHTLCNEGDKPIDAAPWALSVMAVGGTAIIPLPEKIPHTERLTHNQEWTLWGYTDFSDPRWTLGSRYLFFRQERECGPNKLGIAHRRGWVAYWNERTLFVKRFVWQDGARYPDGGVNFETFSNEEFLELESLGPQTVLEPGQGVTHEERWSLFRGVSPCATEEEVDSYILPLVQPA